MRRFLKIVCLAVLCCPLIMLMPQRAAAFFIITCAECWKEAAVPQCVNPLGEGAMMKVRCPLLCGTRAICKTDVNLLVLNNLKTEQMKGGIEQQAEIRKILEEQAATVGLTPTQHSKAPFIPFIDGLEGLTPDEVLNLATNNALSLQEQEDGPMDSIDLSDPASCLRSIEEVSKSDEIVKICGNDRTTPYFNKCAAQHALSTSLYGSQGRRMAKSQYSPAETTRRDWCLKAVLQQQSLNCAATATAYLANRSFYAQHLQNEVMKPIIENGSKPCIAPDTPVSDIKAVLPGCVRQDLVNLALLKREQQYLEQTIEKMKSVCRPSATFQTLLDQNIGLY